MRYVLNVQDEEGLMLNYATFIQRQDRVYEEIRAGHWKARKEGILEDPVLRNPSRTVGIVMRPSQEIRKAFLPWSHNLKKAIPSALVYDPRDLHTTVGVMDCSGGSDEKVVYTLDTCYDAVEEVVRMWQDRDRSRLMTRIDRPIFNQVSTIVKALPSTELVDFMSEILSSCHRRGVALPLPWGTHLTVARFTEPTSAEVVEKSGLSQLMENCPIMGQDNVYLSVDVVQLVLDRRGVYFEVRHRFSLE